MTWNLKSRKEGARGHGVFPVFNLQFSFFNSHFSIPGLLLVSIPFLLRLSMPGLLPFSILVSALYTLFRIDIAVPLKIRCFSTSGMDISSIELTERSIDPSRCG